MKQREIKFRCWDKKKKEMTQYANMFINLHGGVGKYGKEGTKNFYVADDVSGYIPLQWTGFKDSKGVEIYEGDIISYWNKSTIPMTKSKASIHFIDGCFGLVEALWIDTEKTDKKRIQNLGWVIDNCNVEVISNIYEYETTNN